MSEPSEDGRRWRIGAFVFDASTGELRRTGDTGADAADRLAPQPARLLALLAERGGTLVTREEIRRALWPDVHVEFDQGLHHCVRQLRDALDRNGERDAEEASSIENLPRRGYRLRVTVEPYDVPGARAAPVVDALDAAPQATPRRRAPAAIVAALMVIGAATVAVIALGSRDSATRIAIMPFAPEPGSAFPAETRFVADHLLELLAGGPGVRIVGPTTTEQYAGADDALRRVVVEQRPAFVINGRFIDDGDDPRLLAELIRASDGAHVWVAPFDRRAKPRAIAEAIAAEVRNRVSDR